MYEAHESICPLCGGELKLLPRVYTAAEYRACNIRGRRFAYDHSLCCGGLVAVSARVEIHYAVVRAPEEWGSDWPV